MPLDVVMGTPGAPAPPSDPYLAREAAACSASISSRRICSSRSRTWCGTAKRGSRGTTGANSFTSRPSTSNRPFRCWPTDECFDGGMIVPVAFRTASRTAREFEDRSIAEISAACAMSAGIIDGSATYGAIDGWWLPWWWWW